MAITFDEFLPEGSGKPEVRLSPLSEKGMENFKKFADFTAEAEGADYNVIVGGKTFDDFTKHPAKVGVRTKEGPSTAAGRYQITNTTYKELAEKAGVKDFTPESQDKVFIELLKREGAYDDVKEGRFQQAINKLGKTFASFPSSTYSQGKKSWDWVSQKLGIKAGPVTFDEFTPQKKAPVSFDEFTAAPAEQAPTEKTNWAGTGPEMTPKEYFKSGFAGRFLTSATRGDSDLMAKADETVKKQLGPDYQKDPAKFQEMFTQEYKRLATERDAAVKAERAKNPEPTFSQSMTEFGKQLVTSPWQTAKSMVYELGKDPELLLGAPGMAPKVTEAAATVGRAAKVGKVAAEVGKTAAKAGTTGAVLETAAEAGEPGGLDAQRILNTAGNFAVLGAAIHAGVKGVKALYKKGTPEAKVTGEFDKLHDEMNKLDEVLPPEQPKATGPEPQTAQEKMFLEAKKPLEEQVNTDIQESPQLEVAGEVFKSFKDESPIESIKNTIREVKVNNRASTLWRRSIEAAIPDEGIRERVTMALEKEKAYDKLLTDQEKAETIEGLSTAAERLRKKTPKDEADAEYIREKIKKIDYVVEKLKSLPSEEYAMPILKQIETKFKEIGNVAKEVGVMENLRRNYISHVLNFNESKLNDTQRQSLRDRLFGDRKSRFNRDFTQQRHYDFIRELEAALHQAGKDMGLDTTGVKVERDVAKIAEIYQKSMMKAVLERKLLNHLEKQMTRNLAGEEIPLVTKDPQIAFRNGYEFFKGRGAEGLEGYAVHPDLVDPMKFAFRQADPNLFLKALGSVSMLTKYLNTMGSLFHATSLFVARTTSTPGKMLKEIFTAGRGTRMALEELEHNGASESVKLAQRSGLVIDLPEDATRTILTDISNTVDGMFGAKVVGRVVDPVENLLLQKMNRFTWDYMHAAGKLHLWQTWFTKIKSRNPELPDEVIAKEVSSYVNNTLGGLDWLQVADQVKNKYMRALAMKALNQQGRDWAQILLFAPDWTISTIRSFSRALPKELMKPQNWELREGLKGFMNPKTEADLARRYVANTAVLWLTILNGFNMAYTGRPIWTNKDPTRVDLGDGTSMQMAKHSMEFAEWVHDPEKTLGNKLGFWPKALITMMTGKQYPSPRAPMVKDNTVFGRSVVAMRQALPFQVNAAISAPTGEKLKRVGASMVGIPIYGQTNKANTSIEVRQERKKERAESKRENKLEKMKGR